MHGFEILLISFLVAFAQGTNSSRFPNRQHSWIEGGSDASPGEFPYMVYVRKLQPSSVGDCGGSIINNWYVLTTAHCVTGGSAAKFLVVAGTNRLGGGDQTYGVSRVIIHHAIDLSTNNNDIALLSLAKPIVYSAKLRPVTLPKQDETTAPGVGCVIMGWGKTSSSASSFPLNLQKLQVNTISNSECSKHYKYIFDTKICATAGSGKGTCRGDSGGPLICGDKQIGVLRGGGARTSICSAPYPIEFVKVSKYIDWIKQHAV